MRVKNIFMEQSSDLTPWVFDQPHQANALIWLPYLKQLKKLKDDWWAEFQGGTLRVNLNRALVVMIYGKSGDLPVEFLADAAQAGCSVMIHHRHAQAPLTLVPSQRKGQIDILTAQIVARENERKCAVVAKACVLARIDQAQWMTPVSESDFSAVRERQTVSSVRAFEAQHAKRHWQLFFNALKIDSARRESNPLSAALDALSHFTQALLLRWVTLHRLSPAHGYLHESTSYNALLYDLMEPVRHWAERVVFEEVKVNGVEGLTARAMKRYQLLLEEEVEVPALQCMATRKNILHGMVLALRAYLVGDMRRLIFPLDSSTRNKGRPVKASYQIPGAKKRFR